MVLNKNVLAMTGALCTLLLSAAAHAEANKVVIGVIDDMSGLYADISGPGAVEAVKMAIADFGGTVLGNPIELLTFDHQNKPDVGAQKFREWADRDGLTMVHGGANTGVSLAISTAAKEKKVPFFADRRRRGLAHRQGLHALHDPLRLRHNRAWQRHGDDNRQRRAARPGSF